MNVKPTQKTTKLGTALSFKVYDFRGRNNFPTDQGGLVFEHLEKRVIRCKYTGREIKRNARYVVRTAAGQDGWRIDLLGFVTEAVYGLNHETHWKTNADAAKALSQRLDEIRDNSSLGS